MPSLDRVDIREPASRTELVESTQYNKKRQGFAGDGNFTPMVLDSNATELDQAVENVAGYVQNIARDINFTVDAKTNKHVVTVTDQFSGEVIRQIPNEEMLAISKNLEDAQRRSSDKVHKGLLFEGDA